MAWPTVNVSTTYVDSGSDDPSLARPDIKDCFDKVNGIMDALGAASGVCDLDADILIPASRMANETWTAPTLGNSWVDWNASFATGYLISIDGIVYIRGVIKSGTVGATAFTLATGYRPAKRLILYSDANGASARLDINTDGTVVPGGTTSLGNNTYFSLHCYFPVTS